MYCTGFIALTYVLARYVLSYIWPFALGALFAVVIEPLVRSLMRGARLSRGPAVLAALGMFVTALIFVLSLCLSKLLHEIADLYYSLPDIYVAVTDLSARLAENLKSIASILPDQVAQYLKIDMTPVYAAANSVLRGLLYQITSLPWLLLGLLVAFVSAFFMARDRDAITAFLEGLMPPDSRKQVLAANKEVLSSFAAVLRAQVTLAAITGALSAVGMTFLGFKYSLVLGLTCGVLDLLPLLGPSLVYVPMVAWGVVLGEPAYALKAALLFTVVAGTRQILEPRMIGRAVGIHPLASLFSVYVGVRLFGPWGFMVGPLTVVIMRSLVRAGILPVYGGGGPGIGPTGGGGPTRGGHRA